MPVVPLINMTQQSSKLAPEGLYQEHVYHPLSMLAFASLVVGGGFAGVIALLALVAFRSGDPLFLRLAPLLVPTLGAVLAVLGRQQIRRSEGIYTGLALTTWALWLSAISGLGYAAYYFGTYFAVTLQAKDFTNLWFEKLKQDKIPEAFLDTQDPAKRKNDKPSDSEWMFQRYGLGAGVRKGPLPLFQESDVVRTLQDAAKNGRISLLGVKDWGEATGGYFVEQLFQVTTSEGEYNFIIKVRGSEGKEFERRQWNLVWESVGFINPRNLTPLGQTLELWRAYARDFVRTWLTKRNQRDTAGLIGTFLGTIPPPEQTRLAREIPLRWLLGQIASCPASPVTGLESGLAAGVSCFHLEGVAESYLPKFREFIAGSLIHSEGFEALKALREDIIGEVRKNFADPSIINMRLPEGMGATTLARINNRDKHQFLADIELGIFPKGVEAREPVKYRCDAAVVVESDVDPAAATRLPAWRVVRLQLFRGGLPTPDPAAAQRPPQGPGPVLPQAPPTPARP
jgi:hypothetical protein